MPNFKQLRSARAQPLVTDPIEIFRRLPKPVGLNDLYTSQAHVLEEWFTRRGERDLVIKLHTGGGKTLVGLLIAQSILHETGEPVIYLSPNNQVVEQTLGKAQEYGIPAVAYQPSTNFQAQFLNGESVLVCNYQSLFNGHSRFGVRGGSREILRAGGIVLDDAHVAFASVRDSFTLRVSKEKDSEGYSTLTTMFRSDFRDLRKLGTFDDTVSGAEYGVLEVPYWSWRARSDLVREHLRPTAETSYPYVWPLLRDHFDYCHALISQDSFAITPVLPMTDLIPTFAECPRRIFMSATISDDSAIIRTFDADSPSLVKPITSNSLAGVGERMIICPELMPFAISNLPDILRKLAAWAAQRNDAGTVILVPSHRAAQAWKSVAAFPDASEKVNASVRQLQDGASRGPFVFSNRYDGIDLPGQSCRLLIVDGLPQGASEYDLFRASTLMGGAALNSALAQRIEQGIGRGARGAGDFCVVIVTGKGLVSWIDRSSNTRFLSSSTRAQLEIGAQVSRNVANLDDFVNCILACFKRDKEWTEYHAETLAELVETDEVSSAALEQASIERKAFRLWRDGYYERAIAALETYCCKGAGLDSQTKGWLLHSAARVACYWGRQPEAERLHQSAFATNRNLMRPPTPPPYSPLAKPGRQAEMIVERMEGYRSRGGFLVAFEEAVAHLFPEASANQFEQALADLGAMLGFVTERSEKLYGVGPDVLWLLADDLGAIIEAKSRKLTGNAFNRENHGQLLIAAEWFKHQYPRHTGIRISVHPNIGATRAAVVGETQVLTLGKLNELVSDARVFLTQLAESHVTREELVMRCEQLLQASTLIPETLIHHYLVPFEVPEE